MIFMHQDNSIWLHLCSWLELDSAPFPTDVASGYVFEECLDQGRAVG